MIYYEEIDENHRRQITFTDEGEVLEEDQEWIEEGEEVVPGWTNGHWQKGAGE